MILKTLKEVLKNIPKGLGYSGIYGEMACKNPENVFYASLTIPISLSIFEGIVYTHIALALSKWNTLSFLVLPITVVIRTLHAIYAKERCRLQGKD